MPRFCVPLLLLVGSGACKQPEGSGILQLDDDANYQYDAALEIGVIPVAAGEDATVDWSALTVDLVGHPVDPTTGVVQVALAWLPRLSYEAAADALVHGTLLQEDIGASFFYLPEPGVTSAPLTAFYLLQQQMNPAAYLLEGEGVWLVAVQSSTAGGALMTTWIEPRADSDNHEVAVTNESALLDFSAAFAPPLLTTAEGPWAADWGALSTGAGGVGMERVVVDGVWVARYPQWTAEDLAVHYLDAEQEAEVIYRTIISGTTRLDDLEELRTDEGVHFDGFTADATWMIALRCSTCTTPAPPFAAVVEVE